MQTWCKPCLHKYGAANAEKIRARARAWAKNNPERHAEIARTWSAANRAPCNIKLQKYRAALRGAPYSLTLEEWQSILEYFGHACAYCLRTDLPLSQDHVIPVSKGGGTTAENIVPACRPCNSRKGNRCVFFMVNVEVTNPSRVAA